MKSLLASVFCFAFAGTLAFAPRPSAATHQAPLPIDDPAPVVEWPRVTDVVWEEHGDGASGRWLPLTTSAVEVIEGEPPRMMFARDSKLREIGPVAVLDEPAERALGVRWDYQRPALAAIAELAPGIPRAKATRSWPWPDQTMLELGRPAIPLLADAAAANRIVAAFHDDALVRIALRKLLPEVKLVGGQAGEGGRAVMMISLGGRFEAVENAVREAGLNTDVLNALRNYHNDANALLSRALGALSAAWPPDLNDAGSWSEAERALIGNLGLAAERSLALLAEAKPEFAAKVDWMLGEIRKREAQVVLRTFSAKAERTFNLDDQVSVVLCRQEFDAALAILRAEGARLAASAGAADRLRGGELSAALDDFSRLYIQSLQSAGGAVANNLERYKRDLAAGRNTRDALLAELCALPAALSNPFGFCDELASRRTRATALASKCRWHQSQIERREVDPAAGFDPVRGINPLNGGRAWDVQHRSEDIAAVMELRAANADAPVPIALEAGRAYEFSYRVKAINTADGKRGNALSAQAAWIEFIPLDERGLPVFDLIHPRADIEPAPFRYSRSGQWTAPPHLATDGEPGGWLKVRVGIPAVPRSVTGFTLRVVVENIVDEGAVYFDDLVLKRVAEGFADSFESGEVDSPNWTRLVDRERGYMPYVGLTFDAGQRVEGERSLCVRPQGFNFQMTTARTFTLAANRDYVLEGALRCAAMESLRARLEIVGLDGKAMLTTPWRGDMEWTSEWLDLSHLAAAGADSVRVRLNVWGPRPAYNAAVWVDALRIVETPALRWSLDDKQGAPRFCVVEPGRRSALRLWFKGLPRAACRCEVQAGDLPAIAETLAIKDGEATMTPLDLGPGLGLRTVRVTLTQEDRTEPLLKRDLQLALICAGGSSGLVLDSRWNNAALAEFAGALQPQWVMCELWESGGPGRFTTETRIAEALRKSSAHKVAVLNVLPDVEDVGAPMVELCAGRDARKLAQNLSAVVKACDGGAQAFQLGPCFGPQAAGVPGNGLPELLKTFRRALQEGGAPGAVQVIALPPQGLEGFARLFAGRWAEAVRADASLRRALSADELEKLAALAPGAIFLREDERLNLCVPRAVSAADMALALGPWAARIGSFEHPLGRENLREHALAMIAGGAFAGDVSRQFVTLQCGGDVADKRLRLAALGFGTVLCEHRSDSEDIGALIAWRTADRFCAETTPVVVHGLPAEVGVCALRGNDGLRLALTGRGRQVLPLGNGVRALDFAGNETACADDGAGNVTVELSDQPLMLLGVDGALIETLETVACTPALRAETRAQELTLSLQNRFGAALDVTVEVLLAGEMAERAKLTDAKGRPARTGAAALKLGAATLKPGASGEFKLTLRPLPDFPVHGGALALRLTMAAGARRYVILREIAPTVNAEIRITDVKLVAGATGYEVVITAQNATAESADVQVALVVKGHRGLARQARLKLRANASGEVRLAWPTGPAGRATGADVDVGLSQSPGFRFDNARLRLGEDAANLAIAPR
ncbi:MAG: hypothetical protein IT462_13360 [Planctomycetes bacterium]|nr:hypothetical protein [Planctomycetota bacterium]